MKHTFEIETQYLDKVNERFATVVRQAEKLGLGVPSMEIGPTMFEAGTTFDDQVVGKNLVTFEGERPRLGGALGCGRDQEC